jgi:hypothetical protein
MPKPKDDQEKEIVNPLQDPALLEKVETNLSQVFGNNPDTDNDDEGDEEDESTQKPTDNKSVEPDDDDDESSVGDDDEATSSDGEPEELPGNLRRAALHQRWTNEEITELYETNPELARKTFEKMRETSNAQMGNFAKIGQMVAQIRQQLAAASKPKPSDPVHSEPDIDWTALEEEYGSDHGMIKALKRISAQTPKPDTPAISNQNVPLENKELEATLQAAETQMRELINAQVNLFFSDKGLMSNGEFYGLGKSWDKLEDAQDQNRKLVIARADQLLAGAQAVGRDMSVEQALEEAHNALVVPFIESSVKDKIKKTAKKRNGNLTVVPKSSSKPKKVEGKPQDDKEILSTTRKRMKKIGL